MGDSERGKRGGRDVFVVDLCGMKAALFDSARSRGVSPSALARQSIAGVLGTLPTTGRDITSPRTARLSVRISQEAAESVRDAAHAAGLPLGTFIAAINAGMQSSSGFRVGEAVASLTASCAELASLSRDIRHLTDLLRQGSVRAAQEYRERLDTVAADVRMHLACASAVVAELRPLLRSATTRPTGKRRP